MAALELARRGDVTLAQPEPFGDIAIRGAGGGVSELARQLEALLFLSPDPLPVVALCELTEEAPGPVQRALAELAERHGAGGGLEVAEVAGGFTLRTRADLAGPSTASASARRGPLSPAALETLAVVAYLEPVSRPQISRLRGVAVDSTVAELVERGLLEEAGRPPEGGAMRYRTTRAFQERFGLRGAGDLPPLERFELSGPEAERVRRRLAEAGTCDGGGTGRCRVSAMRVHRALALAGVASRRAAEGLVVEGRVAVNGAHRHGGPAGGAGRPHHGRRAGRARRRAAARLPAAQAAGGGLDGQRPAGPPDRARRPARRGAPLPGGPPRHRTTGAHPPHQRRRDGRPPDAPELEGAEDLRGAAARPGLGRDGAAPAAGGGAGGRHDAPALGRADGPPGRGGDLAAHRDHRGPQPPAPPHGRGRGPPGACACTGCATRASACRASRPGDGGRSRGSEWTRLGASVGLER